MPTSCTADLTLASNGWIRYQQFMPISCHFRDCKALLVTSVTHVSGAITNV